MQPKTYRPGKSKQVLAWILIGLALASAVAIAFGLVFHSNELADKDAMAAVGIGVFLAFLVACGVGILRSCFMLGEDYVSIVKPFSSTRLPIMELGGYGALILTVNFVPSTYIRLYRFGPRELAKILVSSRDWREVNAWFGARLPVVIDEGSMLYPKPRYRDADGIERERRIAETVEIPR